MKKILIILLLLAGHVGADNNVFEDCTIQNNTIGLQITEKYNVTLQNNLITNNSYGLSVNDSNVTLIDNIICNNTLDVRNTSSNFTSTNTYCTITYNFMCDYFCTGFVSPLNWTIRNRTTWTDTDYNFPVWKCGAYDSQCEPRYQDMRKTRGIWNITSTNCTLNIVRMSTNATCTDMTYSVSGYRFYNSGVTVTDSAVEVWRGSIAENNSRQFYGWVDYYNPVDCDVSFSASVGGQCNM